MSHFVAPVGLELTIQTRLVSNFPQSSGLSLSGAKVTGIHYIVKNESSFTVKTLSKPRRGQVTKPSIRITVLADLDCQHVYIWSQLKPRLMAYLSGIFLIGSFEVRRPTLDMGHTFSGGSPHKRAWKKEAFAFCLLALTLDGKLIYPVAEAFLC